VDKRIGTCGKKRTLADRRVCRNDEPGYTAVISEECDHLPAGTEVEILMRHIKIWSWILILWAFLILVFVQAEHAETRLGSLDQNIVQRVGGPAQPETGESSSSWQMVGQVGGRTEDVAVQGDYVYVAVGLRLVVLDVSDPTTLQEIGSTTPFPQFVEGVTVSGTLAYVADGMSGLQIVDVSTPTAPIEIGAYDTPGYAEGVAVAGRYAYVADGHYGLRIVDVSDPTEPAEVAYAYPLNYVFDVVMDGKYAYLAAAGAGLLVVDVSDPAHPVELGAYDTPGYAYGVDVAGDVVYVADGWEHVRVVDVSEPANPAELASCSTPGWAFGVDAEGDTLYVADAFAGLQVLDVSDPAHPVGLGAYEVASGHAGRVVVMGETAYIADRNWGLRAVDVSDPGAPTQVGFYGPLGYAAAVATSGDYAYVAAATYGLRVVDVSDSAHPVELGAYDTQGNAIGVAVVGNYAYVSVMCPEVGAGLHVVDISDPAHPTRVGYRPQIEGCYRDIALTEGIAYIANEWGLELIDVSSPYTPTLAGYINLQGDEWNATSGAEVSGTLAYVAQDREGLRVVDVSDLVSPTLMSTFNNYEGMQGAFDVAVAGTRAYLAGGNGLKIIDVSDPLNPTQLGAYGGPSLPERVSVVGSTAYVAFGSEGLYAIDVSDPTNHTLAGSYDTSGYANAATVADDHVYVADGDGGLLVLETGTGEPEANRLTWNGPASTSPARIDGSRGWFPRHGYPGGASLPPDGTMGVPAEAQALPSHQLVAQPGSGVCKMISTCVVTSTADNGPGTLRECMENASSCDTIIFDAAVFPPTSPVTITLQTELPHIYCGNLTIDASDAGVILDGSEMVGGVALDVPSGNNVIRGLQIVNFAHCGMNLSQSFSSNNIIGGDRSVGRGPLGQGNLVSGCGSGTGAGIFIGGSNNVVSGNFIGTDVTGRRAFDNGQGQGPFDHGIFIQGGSYNRIGGASPGERNIISANAGCGITIQYGAGNVIVGNYVGTDVSGTIDLGNLGAGISIELGSPHNLIKGNLVSGSNWGGVSLADWGSDYNTVIGNLIGTDASGTRALGNRCCGVGTGERFNRIGGTSATDRNVISGNPQGISLAGEHNLILGNLIGTDISGTKAIGNEQGVFMSGTSRHNFVGGTTPGERNVISGNVFEGLVVGGAGPTLILGNYVGTDVGGRMPVPNGRSGIAIEGTRQTAIQGNLIATNEWEGVSVSGSEARLRANRIGVAADGVSPLPNAGSGVTIMGPSNTVGGRFPFDGNMIAFNANAGVQVWTYPGNTIRRNSIYGNSGSGILLVDGGNNSLSAPIITDVLPVSVSGTACPGCIVEVFSDAKDEGRIYEGSTTADASGAFTFSKDSPLTGPNITATATDSDGNTSEFSTPQKAWRVWVNLPVILKGQ